ncbi:MAG: FG-GAP-like repeat-containing protein [Promethearchaeota archaeon]
MKKNKIVTLFLLTTLTSIIFMTPILNLLKSSAYNIATKPIDENQSNNLVVNTNDLSSADSFDPLNGIYSWWDPSFTYRFPVEINSTFKNRIDYSVKLTINFTKQLVQTGWNGTLDPNSIRVVEYIHDTGNNYVPKLVNSSESGANAYVVPSLFIPLDDYDNYDAETNAIGQLWFQMNGLSAANTNRTYMIYFDTIENTGGLPSPPSSLVWNKDYNWETDVFGDGKFHLAYGVYRATRTTYGRLRIYNEDMSATVYNSYPDTQVAYYLTPLAGDFNGDGNVELLINDVGDQFWLMDYSPSSGMMYDLLTAPATPINFEAVLDSKINNTINWNAYKLFAIDYDLDGYTEIIFPFWTYNDQERIIIFNLTTSGNTWNLDLEDTIPVSPMDPVAMALADLNQDGYMDIVVADSGGVASEAYQFHIYTFNGMGWTDTIVADPLKSGQGTQVPDDVEAISIGDIDNDGNLEIVISDDDNYKYLYFWQYIPGVGPQFEERVQYNGTSHINPVVGAMYDYDYDGYTEILLGSRDTSGVASIGMIEVTGPEGTPFRFREETEWGWGNTSVNYQNLIWPRFGDIDNDGVNEFFVGSYRNSSGSYDDARVLAWNGTSFTPEWMSESNYYLSGGGGFAYQTMTCLLGAWDHSYVVRMEPSYYIWTSKASAKNPSLEVQVLDVDFGPISNAKVTINSSSSNHQSLITDVNGKVQFDLLQNGNYDIQINYTSDLGEKVVGTDSVTIDSSKSLFVHKDCYTSLWLTKFNITDVDGNLYTKGNLKIFNSTKQDNTIVSTLNLQSNKTFVWLNRTSVENEYNYTITYENPNYNPNVIDIKDDKFSKNLPVNQGANFNSTQKYLVGETTEYQYIFDFTTGRDNYLNWINITITNCSDYIYKVEVSLVIDSIESNIATYSISGTSTKDWSGNVTLWADSQGNLRTDDQRSNVVRLKVYVNESTSNNGVINVTLYDENEEDIQVPMSKKHITVIDQSLQNVDGVILHVYDAPQNPDGNGVLEGLDPLINLTVYDGVALDSNGEPFYYLTKDGGATEGNYTVAADIFGSFRLFWWESESNWAHKYGNFTLIAESSVEFQIQINMDDWITEIEILNPINPTYNFDEDILVRVNITANNTQDGNPAQPIPASVQIYVYSIMTSQIVYTQNNLNNEQLGVYNYTFNFKDAGISLPTDSYSFLLTIIAQTPGYGSDPDPVVATITINPINAQLNAYENSNNILTDITNTKIQKHWGDVFNITLNYHSATANISNADVYLDWDFDSNIKLAQDITLGSGYYTFEINTSKADKLGTYRITFFANQTNYTTDSAKYVDLEILPIQTTIAANYTLLGQQYQIAETSQLLNKKISINVSQSFIITFKYEDSNDNGINAAGTITYTWIKYNENNEVDQTGEGTLIEIGNGYYNLDIDTETLSVGEYTIIINVAKDKYEERQAAITLEILERLIQTTAKGSFAGPTNFEIKQTKDNTFNLSVSLRDLSENLQPLLGATVTFTYEGKIITLLDDDNDGIYTAILDVSEYNSFFSPVTITGKIDIIKANYTSQQYSVTIVIKMDEIFEGFPTFYFALIVGVAAILSISLITYRAIVNARIPEFIRKCDATINAITKKKKISTEPITITKWQYLIDTLGPDWESIALDFKDSLPSTANLGKKTLNRTDSEESV